MTETLGALSRATPSAVIAGVTLVLGAVLALGGCVGGLRASGGASATPTTTTTEWGAIWDSLPPTFPVYPGAEPMEAPAGPASATLAVPAAVRVATVWWQAGLEQAGYSTAAVSGPLEDGGMVIDSTGSGDCMVQVAIVPTGATTTATILYGAGCPYR
jgi:hypothetical protein